MRTTATTTATITAAATSAGAMHSLTGESPSITLSTAFSSIDFASPVKPRALLFNTPTSSTANSPVGRKQNSSDRDREYGDFDHSFLHAGPFIQPHPFLPFAPNPNTNPHSRQLKAKQPNPTFSSSLSSPPSTKKLTPLSSTGSPFALLPASPLLAKSCITQGTSSFSMDSPTRSSATVFATSKTTLTDLLAFYRETPSISSTCESPRNSPLADSGNYCNTVPTSSESSSDSLHPNAASSSSNSISQGRIPRKLLNTSKFLSKMARSPMKSPSATHQRQHKRARSIIAPSSSELSHEENANMNQNEQPFSIPSIKLDLDVNFFETELIDKSVPSALASAPSALAVPFAFSEIDLKNRGPLKPFFPISTETQQHFFASLPSEASPLTNTTVLSPSISSISLSAAAASHTNLLPSPLPLQSYVSSPASSNRHRLEDQEVKRVSVSQLTSYLRRQSSAHPPKYVIVDCRYNYEYNGGHIKGAINLSTPTEIRELYNGLLASKPYSTRSLSSSSTTPEFSSDLKIIFHCEFSQQRGPRACRYFRSLDRDGHVYPHLGFPHLYILTGGFSAFISAGTSFCTGGYTSMWESAYAQQLRDEAARYKTSWSLRKSCRTISFLPATTREFGKDIPPNILSNRKRDFNNNTNTEKSYCSNCNGDSENHDLQCACDRSSHDSRKSNFSRTVSFSVASALSSRPLFDAHPEGMDWDDNDTQNEMESVNDEIEASVPPDADKENDNFSSIKPISSKESNYLSRKSHSVSIHAMINRS